MAHISTDYVFDGARPPPTNGRPTPATAYIPEDLARPLGAYGRTKLLGEDAVLAQDPHHLVVRVASLFGHAGARQKGGNFVDKILARAASGQAIEVVDDQWMTPTSTLDASHGILALVDEGATGRHHVTSGGACTWWDLADAACRARGIDTPVGRRRMEVPSLRPRNSALVAHEAAGWQQALRTYVRETSSGA